ncbi:MAG: DUF2141 domain-containing protein [Bacteroidota bacterium]
MKIIINISLLLFTTVFLHAQNSGQITVNVNDIKSEIEAPVYFMLFNNKDGFPREKDKAAFVGKVQKTSSTVSYTFDSIPEGTYAVAVFLDENKNGKIDTKLIPMPKEPVGASNLEKMSRPSFKKSAFTFSGDTKTINIKFINE